LAPASSQAWRSQVATSPADLAAKRLELLREVVPNLRRLAIIANAGYPGARLELSEIQAAARTLDVGVDVFEIQRTEDITPAFEALKNRAEALYVVGDRLMHANRIRINTLSLAARVATIFVHREYVEAGGLMSYGANLADLFRRAGDFVDKVLRGAKPSELPVEQPTKFDLVVNLSTAKALDLTISPLLLARADAVIE
jgi:putative tryptophan/tyrosine transport system substrate-binding protein